MMFAMTRKAAVSLTPEEKEYYQLVKIAFALLAPFYDAVTWPFQSVRDSVVKVANPGMGSRILDVCTGTGKQAFAFAKNGYDVTAIDLSVEMLNVARRRNRYRNANFQIADATRLPFGKNSFDISCVSFALHDMPLSIRTRVVREMARVTKPNGTVLVVDYGLPKNRIGRFLVYHFVRLYEKYYPEFIKSDLRALLRKEGIAIKEEKPILFGAGRIIKGIKGK